ncbi:MAG: L-dopachrome tautomerase-related protein [Pseudomonadota bacterium]
MRSLHYCRIAVFIGLALMSSLSLYAKEPPHSFKKIHSFDASTPPGNLAISRQGRIFMSTHHFYGAEHKVVEVKKNGKVTPYPTASFSASLNPVLGIVVDTENVLWMLETASAYQRAGRLIGWDLDKNTLFKIIYLAAPHIPKNSFLNDLAVDRKHEAIFVTDTAGGSNSALLVVDLETGKVRRVLEGTPFTQPEDIDMVIDKRVITAGGKPTRIGVNPITIDSKNEWVYFGAMSGLSLYRATTKDLLNEALSAKALAKKVQRYGDKPISDGIAVDDGGNVYITAITNNAIGMTQPNGQYVELFSNDSLSWPDGFAIGPNHQIYFTVNELHRSPVLNKGKNIGLGRFAIFQFSALEKASVGR